MPINSKNEEYQGTLTEFLVTETYYVKARTREEALQMIEDDDFKYDGITNHNINLEVNF
tara:strand:+ start:2249 stop:2425 length:177 start_codon:yes stop_codon:yes gene_type:complete